ncbi:MAG: glycoside hydrolase family 2 [Chloroflexota bacterium]|nr:glycoside hydrolase family 2 [Chloroflexota bacterium]
MDVKDFGFTRDETYSQQVEQYLNPLPRSVVRPGEVELLDGEWQFELDPEDRGLREEWFKGYAYRRTANWPSTIEDYMAKAAEQVKITGPLTQYTPENVVAWYERDFSIPEPWLRDPGRIVQLTFGACGYETRVWLNGVQLSTIEGEPVHYGEYTSFSYELPPELLRPINRLTVRTADTLDAEITRGKQESRVYKRGGIWYQTISGPVRSVWIEPVMLNRLRSRLEVISSIEDRLVEFVITTRTATPGTYNLRLVVTSREAAMSPVVSEFQLELAQGVKRQRLVMHLPDARLWSPDEPNLYQLTAQLTTPWGDISQIATHFGLRRIEARGRHIYLNNQQTYLDGILYQPGTATYEQIASHMHAMKALGCNLVRVHIAGIDPRIYDLADEVGVLLWVEVPSPHVSTQRSRDNHWAELMRMLPIICSHPSVVILSLYNEDWGVQDIQFNALTREYIARTWAYLRVNYPQLLVVDNDGWRHVSTEGRVESHLLTAHIYRQELGEWQEWLDRLVAGENEGVAPHPLVVGDSFFYRGQLPLVVSEWGGFGFSEYGGAEEMSERIAQIEAYKHELRQRPIAGDVYTQATSIEDEVNGLIDPATGELLVPEGLLYSSPPAMGDDATSRGE